MNGRPIMQKYDDDRFGQHEYHHHLISPTHNKCTLGKHQPEDARIIITDPRTVRLVSSSIIPYPPKQVDYLPPKYIVPEEDMVPVEQYGYNENNIRLLAALSNRIEGFSNALSMINDIGTPLDLVALMETAPQIDSATFRSILSDAYSALMKKDLETANKLNQYLYGEPPEDPPAEEPSDDETASEGEGNQPSEDKPTESENP